MKKLISRFFKTPAKPDLFEGMRMLNVEPGYICNLKCLMCQRAAVDHKQGLMSMDVFMRMEPYFSKFPNVVLTGIGEPTINPLLPDMVRTVKQAGSLPCVTTNGTLMTEELARRLMENGLDHCTFSIDGGTRETFERIRVGASWDVVLANAKRFNELRKTLPGNLCPRGTMWSFLMMRDNFHELPEAVRHAAECGFDAVNTNYIAINLVDYEKDQLLHDLNGNPIPELQAVLDKAEDESKRCGIALTVIPYFMPERFFGCQAEPTRSLFVDWMGNVTPCGLRPVRDDEDAAALSSFGNVETQSLEDILAGDAYRKFRTTWEDHCLPETCKTCYIKYRVQPDFYKCPID